MDRQLILEKLESLRRCVGRVSEKCPPTAQELVNDLDLQDIIALNLSRAVQLCVDIGAHAVVDLDIPAPATMGETFDALRSAGIIDEPLAIQLKKAVGFRNIAIYNYEAKSLIEMAREHHVLAVAVVFDRRQVLAGKKPRTRRPVFRPTCDSAANGQLTSLPSIPETRGIPSRVRSFIA
jgi:uncharacterized protein YutE (UPF0331/DUF86 family)